MGGLLRQPSRSAPSSSGAGRTWQHLELSIPDDQREWIGAQVAAGRYASASDYIRELIRRDQQAQKSLRLALIYGERSGVSEHTVSDVARQARNRLSE